MCSSFVLVARIFAILHFLALRQSAAIHNVLYHQQFAIVRVIIGIVIIFAILHFLALTQSAGQHNAPYHQQFANNLR